jgi:threonine synthase
LAPDGGLYVPTQVPRLPAEWRSTRSFGDLAVSTLRPWLHADVPDWEPAVRDALNFPVPLAQLEPGLSVLELFHGPTYSFKDFGARTMARLLARLRRADAPPLTVLVATSGDTGSAVADGFAGLPGFRVVLLFPDGQVSPVQQRQLSVARPGVTPLRVKGTFDDCQRLVKHAFADPELQALHLTSANSINIGRLLPQLLFYVEALRQQGGGEVVFATPSGNLGNLTGGVLALQAGLPVRRFVAAHNANRFFPDRLEGEPAEMGASVRTLSNAMDVGAPSNYERIQTLLGNGLADHVWGTSVSDDDTLASMRQAFDAWGYVACPHTAVGLEAARCYREATGDPTPQIVLATAHPAKFPDVVEQAIGERPVAPEPLAALAGRPHHASSIAATPDALRAVLLAR